jgi:hypothetical protein
MLPHVVNLYFFSFLFFLFHHLILSCFEIQFYFFDKRFFFIDDHYCFLFLNSVHLLLFFSYKIK